MERMVKSSVALEIGDTTIRIVALSHTPTGDKLSAHLEIATPPDTVKNGHIIAPVVLGKFLKSLWAEHKLPSKKVAVILTVPDLLIRIMALPIASPVKLQKWIQEKLVQYVLLADGHYVFGWYKLPDTVLKEQGLCHVVVCAIRQESYDPYALLLREAALTPIAFTLPSIACVRALQGHPALTSRCLLISVYDNQWITHVLEQGEIIYAHISHTPQVTPPTEETLAPRITDIAHSLATLKKPIQTFLLDMPPAIENVMKSLLASKFNLPAEGISCPFLPEGTLPEGAHRCAGAARKEPHALNLTPLHFDQKLTQKMALYGVVYIWILASFVLITFFSLFTINYFIRREITTVQTELHSSKTQFSAFQKKDASLQRTKLLIKGRKKMIETTPLELWATLFQDLPTLLTPDSRLLHIELTPKLDLLIQGEARSANEVFQFIKMINTLPYVKPVHLDEMIQSPAANTVTFKVHTTLIPEAPHERLH